MSSEQVDDARTDGHAAGHTSGANLDDPNLWGWNHTFGKGARAAGWICAVIILLMMIGNHKGHVEDLWLAALGLGMIAVLIYDIGRRRKSWRS